MKTVLLVLISISLMIVDHREGHLESVRSVLSTMVYPLQYVVNMPVQASHWISQSVVSQKKLIEENERLRQEHLLLSSKLQRFDVLTEENKRLRKLLESTASLGETVDKVLIAELVAVEMETFRKQIVINKGERENVYSGQPVVDANGIMGQVVHVSPYSSTVILITDSTHAMPVQINRSGLRTVAVGTGQNGILLLENLSTNSDILVGDLVISSGLGDRFPKGYPVGTVSKISMEPGEAFAMVQVTPSAKLEQSREVLLVWPHNDKVNMNATTEATTDVIAVP